MHTTHCRVCNKQMINVRSHATTCSNSCRSKLWRSIQIPLVSLKLLLTSTDYQVVANLASGQGKSVNEYACTQLINSGVKKQ